MTRWLWPAALTLLAACSGGADKAAPAPQDEAAVTAVADPQPVADPGDAEGSAPDALARWDEDRGYEPDPSEPPLTGAEPGIGTGDKAIPAAVRGRWGLVAADCTSTKGDAKGLLTIDAANLRFYESHGELARIREKDATRIVADYKFSGEGMEWDRLMVLDVQDGGKTLIRRDYGEGAAAGPMRYRRCG